MFRKIVLSFFLLVSNIVAQNSTYSFENLSKLLTDKNLLALTPLTCKEYFSKYVAIFEKEKTEKSITYEAKPEGDFPFSEFKIQFSNDFSKVKKGWILEFISVKYRPELGPDFTKCENTLKTVLKNNFKINTSYGTRMVEWNFPYYSGQFYNDSKNGKRLKFLVQITQENDSFQDGEQ